MREHTKTFVLVSFTTVGVYTTMTTIIFGNPGNVKKVILLIYHCLFMFILKVNVNSYNLNSIWSISSAQVDTCC